MAISLRANARKNFTRMTALVAVALIGVTACSGASEPTANANADDGGVLVDEATCERNRAAGEITYISGFGYSASAGQMDVFLAEEMGFFDALCLDVSINAAGADGQQLVSSGRAQFTALGSASDVLLATANSDGLTAIATYGSTSPFSIFAHEDIESLKDLEDKKLGYFINLTPIASAMLDAADVDVSKVEMIKMTNYDPTVVTRGQVDAIVGYASNQPEALRALGEPFSEFFPADLDVQGTYNIMEANTTFLAEHRDAAADFMRASLKALEYCLENDAECIDMLSELAEDNQQGSAFPRDQLERTWNVEGSWVRENPIKTPGVLSEEQWANEYELVQKYSDVKEFPELSSVMDTDLVADLYDGDTLVWPGK